MGRESAGSVYISIDADAAPLIAKFAQTESAARAAGQRIAGGLGIGLQQGSQQLALFNAILQKSQTEEGKTAQAAVQLATALTGVGASAGTAQTGIKRWSESIQGLGTDLGTAQAKAQSFVGIIPGLGRAAEHFINLLPGVGSAIMSIFPLLGAIALAENVIPMIGKVAGVFGGLTEQEKKAAEEAKTVADEIRSIGESIQSIDFKIMEDSLGRTVALAAKAAKATIDAASGPLIARRALFQSQVDEQKNSQTGAEVLEGVANKGDKKPNKALLDQIALIDAQLYELSRHSIEYSKDAMRSEGEDNKKGEAQAKQALADKRQAFRDYYDGQLADMKAAHAVTTAEELTFRKKELAAVQDQGGMAPVERDVRNQVGTLTQERYREIATASKKFEQDQVRDAKQSQDIKISAMRSYWADVRAGLDETARDFEREQDLERAAIVATTTARNRSAQEGIRAGGVRTQTADEIASLKIQQEYGQQIVHTKAQELQYAKDLGAAEDQRLSDALDTAQKLKDYADTNLLIADQNSADLNVNRAQGELDKERLQNAIRLASLKQQNKLGFQVVSDLKQIGPGVSEALARGIMNGGKGLGQDIKQALSGVGQKLLGDVFNKLIQQLVATSAVQAITNALHITQATTQTAQTAATTAQTAATIANTAALTANASASTAGAAASVAGSAAGAAAGGAIAPIIGGVISGVISAAATLIGDAAIVKAIHGTTAAVISLRGSPIAKGGGTAPKVEIDTSTGFLSSIGAGLFQAITGAGALPVRVVAISPLAPLAGLFGWFGFASGGRPAPGVPYIVGENGPELRIDDGPGTIIPSVPSGGMSRHSSLTTSSAVSNSSSQSQSNVFHLHGIQNVEQFARRLPNVLKARAPVFSPATR